MTNIGAAKTHHARAKTLIAETKQILAEVDNNSDLLTPELRQDVDQKLLEAQTHLDMVVNLLNGATNGMG